ncbi:alpha/beta fold hydrolase [Roseisolibacter agri]|uniref:Alpha/beta hydrolase n=1 Tax=Roseisolibacter agri TaxID=2014610 RepID=A0AA37Q857_9BACT|nr:alpha/beta fold hydrolase [Roseisolibacter agri]GLC28354.1 alpha/beta hydrolase [Roseisolibacter agri]
MRWRTVALSGGAALGVAALFNAVAETGVTPLANPLGGETGTWHWRGHRIAWTRRGDGPAVLLVHALHDSAWSHEWRHVVAPLATDHTVWTLDLPGFGRSARPAARYSAALYVALLDEFARTVIGAPCALVGSALGGAYTVALAARDARRFPALVLACPAGVTHLASAPTAASDAARTLLESPVVGTAAFNARVTRASLRHALTRAYADPSRVTPALLDAHHATAHQPGARFAPAAFVGGALNLNVRDALRRLEQPVLLTWGRRARDLPPTERDAYRTLLPDAEVATFASGSLPHDECADEWVAVVRDFLMRAGAVGGAHQVR